MPYHYDCDGFCDGADGDTYDEEDRPALTGEFNEHWYESTPYGDQLRQAGYEPGDLVTLCPDCVDQLLLEA